MDTARFSLLVENYLQETLSDPERAELAAMLEQPEGKEIAYELIEGHLKSRQFNYGAELEHLYIRIEEQARLSKPQVQIHRVHFLKTAWFKYAAAIIIMFGIGAYLWNTQQKEKPQVTQTNPAPVENDIMPGQDRAILTLSNGQQVELNNATSETINDGTLSIKNSNGQLLYSDSEHGSLSSAGGGGRILPVGRQGGPRTATNTMSTPRGGQYKLTLSDGTRVWLNAASSITYPISFIGKTREVSITGEAYFEVSKNPKQPFIVKTPGEDITVLGTSFNINTYEDEPAMKTSLLEGSVKIGGTILQPGQAYVNGKIIQTDIEQDVAWKNGVFAFTHSDIKAVMRRLARWYDVDVEYEGAIPEGEFSGKIGQKLSLSKVMDVLRDDYGVHYRIENRKLIIGKS